LDVRGDEVRHIEVQPSSCVQEVANPEAIGLEFSVQSSKARFEVGSIGRKRWKMTGQSDSTTRLGLNFVVSSFRAQRSVDGRKVYRRKAVQRRERMRAGRACRKGDGAIIE
jgi:hypothetical protein